MPVGAPLVVVSGPSGGGKSTLCRLVAAAAHARGVAAFGVTGTARHANGSHLALDVENVSTGERQPLAEWQTPTVGPSTGPWHFHTAAFDAGIDWCRQVPPGALLIVDEFGPVELRQGLGWAPLVPLVRDHDGPVMAVVRPSLVDTFVGLVAGRCAAVVEIDASRRDEAYEAVLAHLGWGA